MGRMLDSSVLSMIAHESTICFYNIDIDIA